MGWSVLTTRVLCLSVWLSPMSSWSPGQRVSVVARSGQSVVRREQLVDVASDLDARADHHDEVVTDLL